MFRRLLRRNIVIGAIIVGLTVLVKLTKSQSCEDSSSRPGKCTTMAKCPHLIEQFYDETRLNLYTVDFQTFVGGSICGFDGNNFMVCCAIHKSSVASNLPTRRPVRNPSATTTPVINQPYAYELYFVPLGGNNLPSSPSPPTLGQYPWNVPSTTVNTVVFQPQSPLYAFPTQSSPYNSAPASPSIPTIYQVLPTAPTTRISSTECGISRGTINRVVGGGEAKRSAYPWIAALGYNENNTLKYLCAGSLISPKYVLTSAHCINPALKLVRLGVHNLSDLRESGAMDITIRRSVVHEHFDLKSIANDIAIIELSNPVISTNSIATICLPESSSFLSQDFVGMHPFIAGWGSTKYQGPTSNILRDVQVPIVSRQTCEQSYRSVFQFVQFSDKLICAGNSNVDACQGDSGGPLMMPQLDANTYRYFLLGIVSYGYECARPGFPGVYTRVAKYIPWIKSQMV